MGLILFLLRNLKPSDNVEQQIILSRGGTRISARELEAEVNNSKNKVNHVAKKLKEEKVTALDDEIIHKLKILRQDISNKNKNS